MPSETGAEGSRKREVLLLAEGTDTHPLGCFCAPVSLLRFASVVRVPQLLPLCCTFAPKGVEAVSTVGTIF